MSNTCRLAFGLSLPAKPAFNVAVPLSMTTGWLRNNELPVPPSPDVSSDGIIVMFFKLVFDVIASKDGRQIFLFLIQCFKVVGRPGGRPNTNPNSTHDDPLVLFQAVTALNALLFCFVIGTRCFC